VSYDNDEPIPSAGWWRAVFFGLLFVSGNLTFGIYPVFVTSMVAAGRASAGDIGGLASAEFLPFGLAILFAGRFLPVRQVRSTTAICLLVQLAGCYLTTILTGHLLLAVRCGVGLASGVLVWLCYAYVAQVRHVGRLVAIYTTIQMSYGVVFSWFAPAVIVPRLGHSAVLMLLAGSSLLALMLLPIAPGAFAAPESHSADTLPAGPMSPAAMFLLVSVVTWSGFGAIFWVYAEPLAASYTDQSRVGHWLTVSLIFQIAGAALSSVLAERLPYKVVIAVGLLVLNALVVMLLIGASATAFVIWTAIYGFLGYFLVPYYIGALVDLDPSRRSVIYFPAAQMLASSLGPLAASLVIGDGSFRLSLATELVAILVASSTFALGLALKRRETTR